VLDSLPTCSWRRNPSWGRNIPHGDAR